jgi:enterochelin esterase-like enzyme
MGYRKKRGHPVNRTVSSAIEITASLFPPNVQDAVLGDLEESGESEFKKLFVLLEILARKQLEPWRTWHPWIAGGASISGALLLLGASFCLSLDLRPLLHGGLAHANWSLLPEIILLLAWSWTAGFAVGSLSRKTAWANALLCSLPCLSCVTHFREPSLSRFCVLLFLTPSLLGAFQGTRRLHLHFTPAIVMATSTTGLMFAWPRMWPSFWFLLFPAWFLVATAQKSGTSNHRNKNFNNRRIAISLTLLVFLASLPAFAADSTKSQLVPREIQSKCFASSKIGVSPIRKLLVYLPAGYEDSTQHYPVVYFFPSPFDSSFRAIFDKQNAQGIIDHAITAGIIGKFIFVTVDMTTPVGSSWYVNSQATGNWEDFAIKELVPYIDANFRTLPTRDSRGIAGHFMGGYGAIRLAMEHPDIFGSVYALHPVGTGSGVKVLASLPNWDLMEQAKSIDDVKKDGYSTIFTSIFEAHLPNPNNPPLYIDFPAHRINGQLIIDAKVMDRLRGNFFIESLVGQYADNLKSLRGFKFDWARSDLNWDHVYSNQALTHKLNEYGIKHEAEEYNGTWDSDVNWGAEGRVTTDMLPFFWTHLVF